MKVKQKYMKVSWFVLGSWLTWTWTTGHTVWFLWSLIIMAVIYIIVCDDEPWFS